MYPLCTWVSFPLIKLLDKKKKIFVLYPISLLHSNLQKFVGCCPFIQVESILDKENFTLEELLDEEEIIQECKGLNSRLINL